MYPLAFYRDKHDRINVIIHRLFVEQGRRDREGVGGIYPLPPQKKKSGWLCPFLVNDALLKIYYFLKEVFLRLNDIYLDPSH